MLKEIGNYGQHQLKETATASFAASTCFTAIELCAQLAEEIGVK